MTVPLVSIILPTYNRLAYLPQAVESVLRQTEDRWELLVADDGSTDGTPSYLATLTDPRIRVLRLAHGGHPEAVRNVALPQARGRFIAFLDSDDWWEPEKLSLQLAALALKPECGWSYTALRRVDQDGHDLPLPAFVPYDGMVLDRFLAGPTPIVTSTVLALRELLEALGGFDASLAVAGDLDLWMRLAERSPAVAVNRVLVTRRRHPGNHGAVHGESLQAVEEVFRRFLARARSSRTRRLILQRRARWLVGVADRCRNERRYRTAMDFLHAATPHGLALRGWWVSWAKTLVRRLMAPPERPA